MPLINEIIAALETAAPPCLQEEWDNSGIQTGPRRADQPCTGAVLCVDVTHSVIDTALAHGCNLIVSHHPLIFRGLKRLTADGEGALAYRAVEHGITVYSAHTSLDNAPGGVSHTMAALLFPGAQAEVLAPMEGRDDCGTGVIVTLPQPLAPEALAELVAERFHTPSVRHSAIAAGAERTLRRVALVGGSGGSFIRQAISRGADAIVTSDVRYHDFLDLSPEIFIVDITHFDSEKCAEQIFMRVISEKFPNFAPCICGIEPNPISNIRE